MGVQKNVAVHMSNCIYTQEKRMELYPKDIIDDILFVRLSKVDESKLGILGYMLCRNCKFNLKANQIIHNDLKNFI